MLESDQIEAQIAAATGELPPGALKRLKADKADAIKRETEAAKAPSAERAQLEAQAAALTLLLKDVEADSDAGKRIALAIESIGLELAAL